MMNIGDTVLIIPHDWSEKLYFLESSIPSEYGIITGFAEKDFYNRHFPEPYKMLAADITLENGKTKRIIGMDIDKEDYFSKDEFLAEIGKEIGKITSEIKHMKADIKKSEEHYKHNVIYNVNMAHVNKATIRILGEKVKDLRGKQKMLERLEKRIENDPKLQDRGKVWEPVKEKYDITREKYEPAR